MRPALTDARVRKHVEIWSDATNAIREGVLSTNEAFRRTEEALDELNQKYESVHGIESIQVPTERE